MSVAQRQADIQRAEAKRLINKAFKLEENIESELLNQLIDCIIGAAILEISAIYQGAANKAARYTPNVRVNGRDAVASQLNDGLGQRNNKPATYRTPPIKKEQTLTKATPH